MPSPKTSVASATAEPAVSRTARAAWRDISGILLLDKPLGLSSNQALQQARRLYAAEKAGHTGSLDPLATGMLPLCFGQATKVSAFLLDSDKRYVATVRVGERTTTGDAEGAVVERTDAAGLTREALEAQLPKFTGPIWQVPPMYSALKHEGRRLYELARAGTEVERAARAVTILELRLIRFEPGEIELDLRCSKGTYVRTLAEDLAAAVGQCAHLVGLRRLDIAPFGGARMYTLEQLEQQAAAGGAPALDAMLLAPAAALVRWPQLRVTPAQARLLARGQALQVDGAPASGTLAVLDETGELLGVAAIDGGGRVAPRRWLAGSA